MTSSTVTIAVAASLMVGGSTVGILAGGRPQAEQRPTMATAQHHYTMTGRVRPLLLFWIGRSDVGEATVTWRGEPGALGYELLIGSDPERAPRRINRWGYIAEEMRGGDARVIGVMTESEEESIEDAEAGLKKQANGQHAFKVIHASVNGGQARSVVTTIGTPEDYSFRDVRTLLELAEGDSSEATRRVVQLPAGTRPGFLSALAELVHAAVESVHQTTGPIRPTAAVAYVYHGKIYELRATRARLLPELAVGTTTYRRVITADFEITNTSTRERTVFSMTYGTDGSLAEVPVTMKYQPRWWLQVGLALDDNARARVSTDGASQ